MTASRFDATLEHRADGVMIITPNARLGDFAPRLNDCLRLHAAAAPGRVFLAEREAGGAWRALTYGQALDQVTRLASAFARRDLSAERPVLILSGNSITHALVALAAMEIGIPYCPVSTAYSLVSRDFGKLKYAVELLTPGLIYADDAIAYGAALKSAAPPGVEIVIGGNAEAVPGAVSLASLLATPVSASLEARRGSVTPDTIAKFLLTSGSTGMPKAVINTVRMLTSNQTMALPYFPFLSQEPPVFVDWLPWNHTFGSNQNFGFTLTFGGTLYIDAGRPTPDGMAATLRNLMEIAPTAYFNVPKGHEALLQHLKSNAPLREKFFSRLKALFYAGAGLPKPVWDGYRDLSLAATGKSIPFFTGLGATETSPSSLMTDGWREHPSNLGLPMPGAVMKLVPDGSKLEIRIKGPHVMPGYWRQPDKTAKAFDEEGFYKFGDAIRFADPDDVNQGFFFDGRVAEDFKLGTGTWVSVGPLRAAIIEHFQPLVRDAVIAGADRGFVSALIFPDMERCKAELGLEGTADDVAGAAPLREFFHERLQSFARKSTGSSNRVTRLIVMAQAPSIDLGEVTDKGSINQRAVLEHRAGLVEKLYAEAPSADVIAAVTAAPGQR